MAESKIVYWIPAAKCHYFQHHSKIHLRPADYTLRAANETRIEILGCAQVPITTELYSLTVDGIVTNHVTEVMLGADWLTDNNAQWNILNSTISLGGRIHELIVRPQKNKK